VTRRAPRADESLARANLKRLRADDRRVATPDQ
jgi:hypothetical protein